MISRDHRFHGYTSLRFVYRNGQVVRSQTLNLKYARNNRRRTYRAAVVVGRKVNKSAVGRNRMRRRVYEALRQLEPQIIGPVDLVFTVVDANLDSLPAAALARLVGDLLAKAGALDSTAKPANHGIVDTRQN